MPPAPTPADIEGARHLRVDVGEVTLHVVEAGQGGARPLVVLLHGFPEFWWSWRHQIGPLAAAGYRLIVPDLRGFNLSDKPRPVSAYRRKHLEADVAGLIRACDEQKAVVIGHDWGAAVAWSFAEHYPRMVQRLGILNGVHPRQLAKALRKPRQLMKSSYMFFFQLPALPEWWLSRRDFRSVRRLLERQGMSGEEVQRYVDAARTGENLRGGLHYYRAALRETLTAASGPLRPIEAPTLVIWGEKDPFLGPELATPDPRWVPDARVVMIPDASHWVHHDAAARVNELLLDFLRPTLERAG
jgi:pimeloyl-ACP methyl ester carboxylesterase